LIGKRLHSLTFTKMKKCPQCGSTYTDRTLSYCLTDGSPLEEDDPGRTEAFVVQDSEEQSPARQTERGRVNIGIPSLDEVETAESGPGQKEFVSDTGPVRRTNFGLVALLVFFIVIVVAGVSVFVTYSIITGSNQQVSSDPTVDVLRKQLKELSEQVKKDGEKVRRVNSPGDGFLALRDMPSAKVGRRLAKIPHGSEVVIEGCQEKSVVIGGRRGKWCRARWNNTTGWVFDVWLTG
jgi:hypothetical protein